MPIARIAEWFVPVELKALKRESRLTCQQIATKLGAIVSDSDPSVAADWFAETFGMRITGRDDHAAVLEFGVAGGSLTLLGPVSGISAQPGLPWAPFNVVAEDLTAMRDRLSQAGAAPSEVNGDEQTCFWFTATDPDGNTLLLVDR